MSEVDSAIARFRGTVKTLVVISVLFNLAVVGWSVAWSRRAPERRLAEETEQLRSDLQACDDELAFESNNRGACEHEYSKCRAEVDQANAIAEAYRGSLEDSQETERLCAEFFVGLANRAAEEDAKP